jgi:hypothetical protein
MLSVYARRVGVGFDFLLLVLPGVGVLGSAVVFFFFFADAACDVRRGFQSQRVGGGCWPWHMRGRGGAVAHLLARLALLALLALALLPALRLSSGLIIAQRRIIRARRLATTSGQPSRAAANSGSLSMALVLTSLRCAALTLAS